MMENSLLGRGIVDVADILPHEAALVGPHFASAHDLDERPQSSSQPIRNLQEPRYEPVILIADDEPELVRLLEYQFNNYGYITIVARNGREALNQAFEHKPDLILLDLMLPELHGYEVCRILKGSPIMRLIPIIMLTALAMQEDKQKGFMLGADDYITKPFEIRELLSRVNAVLGRTYGRSCL